MSIDKTAKDLMEALQPKSQPAGYDTQATVTRVEDDTLWVHIPGGVDETPVRKTVGASVGDVLQIRVAAGQAWAVGNASAPPTDDTRANEAMLQANSAQASADIAAEAASAALASAAEAADAASYAVAQSEVAAEAAQDAKEQAESATESATTALVQLSVVEDVVGTLTWISEHGVYAATTDTEVVHGKLYFTRSGSGTDADPYVYTVVTSPAADPSAAGYYELVSVDEAVSNYIATHLALTDEGLYIINDSNSWRVLLKNDGMYIMDPFGAIVAQYKDAITIGKSNQSNAKIDYHSFQLIDKDGNAYFHVSDLRDATGNLRLSDVFWSRGLTKVFELSYPPLPNNIAVFNDLALVAPSDYSIDGTTLTFNSNPGGGRTIRVIYNTDSSTAKALTFGSRYGYYSIGGYSSVFGDLCDAPGLYSQARGYRSEAIGKYSHAEGNRASAWGIGSHAEGNDTCALEDYQHVFGKYNIINFYTSYVEIVGNGTDNNNRSNARTLDWDGNEVLAGGLKINGTTDVGAALNKLKYATYSSVTQLGLTSGSATISGAYNALASNTILFCIAGEFASGQVPNTYGCVLIRKVNGARGSVQFFSKASDGSDYRMYLDASNLPSGVWHKVNDIMSFYAAQNTTTTITLPSSGTWRITTGHNSTPEANTIWTIRTGGNTAFLMSRYYASNVVTVACSGTTVKVTTGGVSVNVYAEKLG